MNARPFKLDRNGVAAILKGREMSALVDRAASDVVANVVTPEDADVRVRLGTTDRAVALVVVEDGRALGWQAKHGTLTQAAAAAGVEVQGR